MVLVSDVLDHIGQIYSPLNLGNMKIQKLKTSRRPAELEDNYLKVVLHSFMFNIFGRDFQGRYF